MDNFTTASPDHNGPTLVSNIVISVIIGILLMVGLVGSLTTALVIARNKELHTKANIFIFSLCISDLVSGLFCSPLWLYRRTWGFQYWYLTESACQFYWVLDYATNFLTSLHVVSFSALRYAAIKKPFNETSVTKKAVILYVALLWTIGLICALPLGFLMGVDLKRVNAPVGSCWPSCSIANRQDCCVEQFELYITIMNSVMFFLPQFFIVVFSILITWEIRKNTRRRRIYFMHNGKASPGTRKSINRTFQTNNNFNKTQCNIVSVKLDQNANDFSIYCRTSKVHNEADSSNRAKLRFREKGAYLQLMLIVLAYWIGYIPASVYLQWSTAVPKDHKGAHVDYWFGVVSYLTLRLSECMNPFMYNFGSSVLRSFTKKFFSKLFCCRS